MGSTRSIHDGSVAEVTSGALAGLEVIDVSTTLAGAWTTQFLSDAGARVLHVEPPGGSRLRDTPGWPALARGRESVVLDLDMPEDLVRFRTLLSGADVFVNTLRPRTAERLELTAEHLAQLNPKLVSASITGWGRTGAWADLKGYEAMVLAKLGIFHAKRMMQMRPGPAFVSVPYASWGASQAALHGVFGALLARERTGVGQHVETDLVRGLLTLDTWDWFLKLVAVRWPDAYSTVDPFTEDLVPASPMIYPLLIAPTKDGHLLQFAQVQPRLFAALLEEIGLTEFLADPKWKGFPALESPKLRTEAWELMIAKVGERTLAEWTAVMDHNPNISAELLRTGANALEHPQIVHDGRVVVGEDAEFGLVRQPSTLVHSDDKPLSLPRSSPRLDEHRYRLDSLRSDPANGAGDAARDIAGSLPLAGITIVEFGLMFAGPYASSMLADLGARVIKVESLEGDEIRRLQAFPEAGGARVMQGKESICLDLTTDEGRAIAHDLVRRADVVLQAFRAGAAERTGVDHDTLKAINPDLVYISTPGYGTSGPYSTRPAYAPSIASATGLSLTDVPDVLDSVSGTMEEVKRAAVRAFSGGVTAVVQADGVSALGAASAMLLGLVAKARGRELGHLTTTMLGTASHALIDRNVHWEGRPASQTVDPDGHGFSALYRMYQAREGWIFLATPEDGDWKPLLEALGDSGELAGNPVFATEELRAANDGELAKALETHFAGRSAAEWEQVLAGRDLGCVEVTERHPADLLQSDERLAAEYCAVAHHPVFDEHLRIAPPVRFSRSTTTARGGCLAGQHTDDILRDLGHSEAAIADLRGRKIVGG